MYTFRLRWTLSGYSFMWHLTCLILRGWAAVFFFYTWGLIIHMSSVEETRVWRKYTISIMLSMMSWIIHKSHYYRRSVKSVRALVYLFATIVGIITFAIYTRYPLKINTFRNTFVLKQNTLYRQICILTISTLINTCSHKDLLTEVKSITYKKANKLTPKPH